MTENAMNTAKRLGMDALFVSRLESRLTDPGSLEEAVRMFHAGTLPYSLVFGSDVPIDLEKVKARLVKNLIKRAAGRRRL